MSRLDFSEKEKKKKLSSAAVVTGALRVKEEHLKIILGEFSQVLHKNIYCGDSLEVPGQGISDESP